MAKSIQELINKGKEKAKTIQPLGIQIPSLVSQQGTTANTPGQENPLVYTVIEILNEGTDPSGAPISGGSTTYCLPPPIQIIDLHSANWEGIPFGEKIGRVNDVRAGRSPLVGAAASFYKFLEDIAKDAYNGITGTSSTTNANKLLRARIAGEDLYNIYSVGTATAINPNIELAFRSANLRNMQLNFRLIPLNQSDANNMKQFMDKMKLMMYAKSDNIWATGYPAKFGVQVKTNGSGGNWSNNVLFSLGKSTLKEKPLPGCVLTDFQVSYGEGGIYAGHYDGSPGVIDLNLTFQETTLSTRETISSEYGI